MPYVRKIRYRGRTVEESGAAAQIKASIDEILRKSIIEVTAEPATNLRFAKAGSNTLRLESTIKVEDDGKLFQIGEITNNGTAGTVGNTNHGNTISGKRTGRILTWRATVDMFIAD